MGLANTAIAIALMANVISSCGHDNSDHFTGEWSVPGVGRTQFDAKTATVRGRSWKSCGKFNGSTCGTPTRVTGYTVSKTGDIYEFRFSDVSTIYSSEDKYLLRPSKNEVRNNSYGIMRFRQVDSCTLEREDGRGHMTSLSSSCIRQRAKD